MERDQQHFRAPIPDRPRRPELLEIRDELRGIRAGKPFAHVLCSEEHRNRQMPRTSFFAWQLTIFLLTMLLATASESMAKPRKKVQHYVSPVAAVPEDPQAYAMRIARQTWPGRPLCDDGGFRIRPCDSYPSGRH